MTKIEWADESWNPIGLVGGGHGCTKVSPGCANCYAEALSKRFWKTPPYDHRKREFELRDPKGIKLGKFKPGSLVFVQSMSDLFHRDVPGKFRANVYGQCMYYNNLTFAILTKHADRMLQVLGGCDGKTKCNCDQDGTGECWKWPLKNVWYGVTAENQEQADKRIPRLLQTPAAKRFVSVEPMLGPVNLTKYLPDTLWRSGLNQRSGTSLLDWVIIGCESGPKRRPMEPGWIINLVRQCKAANVPVFVKQVQINGKVCKDISHFPPELQVRQFPTREET